MAVNGGGRALSPQHSVDAPGTAGKRDTPVWMYLEALCLPPVRPAAVVQRADDGKEIRPQPRWPGFRGSIGRGGGNPPPPSRAPSLCPAAASLTPSAGFNGICNRQ